MGVQSFHVEWDGHDFSKTGAKKITTLLSLYNVDSNDVLKCVFSMRLENYELIERDENGVMETEHEEVETEDGSYMREIPKVTHVVVSTPARPRVRTPMHPKQSSISDFIDPEVATMDNGHL